MKYPKINHKELSENSKKLFRALYELIDTQIGFDNQENDLDLTKSDIELLAWNVTTVIIHKYEELLKSIFNVIKLW